MAEMTTTAAHEDFDALLERVTQGKERVLLRRDDRAVAAMVPVEDYALLERIKATGQEWFWTPEWQAGEREADADIAAGRTTFYGSDEEFLAALKARHGRHADV